jgi:hypothetical protein
LNVTAEMQCSSRIIQYLQILRQTIDPVEQAAYNNDVRYRFNDLFFGLHYKFIVGKFNPGFSVHQYNTTNEQFEILNFTDYCGYVCALGLKKNRKI